MRFKRAKRKADREQLEQKESGGQAAGKGQAAGESGEEERRAADAQGPQVTIEDQLATIIGQNERVITTLTLINEGVRKLATAEQIAALNSAIDELEAATTTEIDQINAKIDELVAAAAGQPDPALDAAVARLEAQRDKIANIISDAPAEAPVEAEPAADAPADAPIE